MPPIDHKSELDSEIRRSRRNWLDMPVIGMESEFNVWLDEVEINPEPYWKHPSAFIDRPLLKREKSSLQLPTGGAVYFDRGVIEVVTPVIELAPSATARMVRNLWEQIGFVRDQLTKWGERNGHTIRLKAYSTHYNVSYEIPKSRQHARRNVKALALLLAYLLPVPVMITGANRRSTGVGVRPRGNRIEITVDFTPDPGLMIATAALIVGIVREVMSWPSYDLSLLESLPLPVIANVIPGKHTTRKGWLTKDFHYPQSPYTSDIDAPIWTTQFDEKKSLRQIAKEVAFYFRSSIRKYSDPFSLRLLFAILEGRAPSLLELDERPKAYDDVGNLCRWGEVIAELREFGSHERRAEPAIEQYVVERHHAREQHESDEPQAIALKAAKPRIDDIRPRPLQTRAAITTYYIERRRAVSLLNGNGGDRRRGRERRRNHYAIPFPDRRLTRSAYEQVFLKLVSGGRLRMGDEVYTPIGMKGWYHAIFRRDSDGVERLLTIDQLLKKMNDWI